MYRNNVAYPTQNYSNMYRNNVAYPTQNYSYTYRNDFVQEYAKLGEILCTPSKIIPIELPKNAYRLLQVLKFCLTEFSINYIVPLAKRNLNMDNAMG